MILRNQKIVIRKKTPEKSMASVHTHHVSSIMEKKDRSHIFNGVGYEVWRYRLIRCLAAEGLKELLAESDEEKQYIQSSEEKRVTMKDFDTKTEKGLAIIVERLENRFVERIRKLVTVSQVIKALDRDFRVTTKVGLMTAMREYRSMIFGVGGDLGKYLLKHEAAAQKVEESGGELSDEEKVHQLHASLPEIYDSVLDWFEFLPAAEQNYYTYRKKLLEKFERLNQKIQGKPNEKNPRTYQNNQRLHNNTRFNNTRFASTNRFATSNNRFSSRNNDRTCYICKSTNHIARLCPRNWRADENTKFQQKEQQTTSSSSNSTANTSEGRPDWTKFKNYKKPQENSTSKATKSAMTTIINKNEELQENELVNNVNSKSDPINREIREIDEKLRIYKRNLLTRNNSEKVENESENKWKKFREIDETPKEKPIGKISEHIRELNESGTINNREIKEGNKYENTDELMRELKRNVNTIIDENLREINGYNYKNLRELKESDNREINESNKRENNDEKVRELKRTIDVIIGDNLRETNDVTNKKLRERKEKDNRGNNVIIKRELNHFTREPINKKIRENGGGKYAKLGELINSKKRENKYTLFGIIIREHDGLKCGSFMEINLDRWAEFLREFMVIFCENGWEIECENRVIIYEINRENKYEMREPFSEENTILLYENDHNFFKKNKCETTGSGQSKLIDFNI